MVSEALHEAANAARLNHRYIISGLMRNSEAAIACDPPQYSASNRAYELLARRVAPDIGSKRIEVTGNIERQSVQHPELTAAEIRAILAHHYQAQGEVIPTHRQVLPEDGEVIGSKKLDMGNSGLAE